MLALDVKVYEEKEKTILQMSIRRLKCHQHYADISLFISCWCKNNNSRCRASDRMNTGEYTNILQICKLYRVAQIDDITVEEDGLLVDGAIIANVFYVTANDAAPRAVSAPPFRFPIKTGKV